VPVFPAIGSFRPGHVPWPIVTTRRADSRMSRQVVGLHLEACARPQASSRTVAVPWASSTSFRRCGTYTVPPFATDAYAFTELERRDGER